MKYYRIYIGNGEVSKYNWISVPEIFESSEVIPFLDTTLGVLRTGYKCMTDQIRDHFEVEDDSLGFDLREHTLGRFLVRTSSNRVMIAEGITGWDMHNLEFLVTNHELEDLRVFDMTREYIPIYLGDLDGKAIYSGTWEEWDPLPIKMTSEDPVDYPTGRLHGFLSDLSTLLGYYIEEGIGELPRLELFEIKEDLKLPYEWLTWESI